MVQSLVMLSSGSEQGPSQTPHHRGKQLTPLQLSCTQTASLFFNLRTLFSKSHEILTHHAALTLPGGLKKLCTWKLLLVHIFARTWYRHTLNISQIRGCEIILFWFLVFLINSDVAMITGLVWLSLVFLPVQFFACFPIG